jgi:hypothetical protein
MHESFGTSELFVENTYPNPGAEVADEAGSGDFYDGTQFDVEVAEDRVRSPDYLPDQMAEDADCVDMASTPEAIDAAHAEALLADMHA